MLTSMRHLPITLGQTTAPRPNPLWVTLLIGGALIGVIAFFYAPGWKKRIGYKGTSGLRGMREDRAEYLHEERYTAVEDAIMSLDGDASDGEIIRYAQESIGAGGGSRAKFKSILAEIKRGMKEIDRTRRRG